MITPGEVIHILKDEGWNLTPRGLRLWRARKLLPELTKQGSGRGRGVKRGWSDDGIVDRIRYVAHLMAVKNDILYATLASWKAGFAAVDIELVREAWTADLDVWADHLRKEGPDSVSITAARKSKKYTSESADDVGLAFAVAVRGYLTGQLRIGEAQLEFLAAGARALGICDFQPAPFIAFLQPVVQIFSIKNNRKIANNATAEELKLAHCQWSRIIRLGILLAGHHVNETTIRNSVIEFADTVIFLLLRIGRTQFFDRVDSSLKQAEIISEQSNRSIYTDSRSAIESLSQALRDVWSGVDFSDFLMSIGEADVKCRKE